MKKIKILAGDLSPAGGPWYLSGDVLCGTSKWGTRCGGEKVPLRGQIESLEQVTEENAKSIGNAFARGAAGAPLFGPVGALGGLLLGKNKHTITFSAALKDGRRLLAQCDAKALAKLLALAF